MRKVKENKIGLSNYDGKQRYRNQRETKDKRKRKRKEVEGEKKV